MTPEAANKVVDGLKQAGIDFVAYLPETRLSEILPVLKADDSFTLVPVASEAEAVGIAAGASLGGKQPALYMEGTGLFVSSYNLLTLGERYGVPMLLLISYIGSMDDQRSTFLYSHYGTHTVPQLKALGIQYEIVKDAANIETDIKNAVRLMHGLKQPVALLFTGEFTI
ncbi:MAG TPA: thiamine pyrophosphate-binding protein [Candidatus Binatia bacterium]|nr:thiamine pyrophosphate-binding protein [Candidatus Binatia bacterium]